jgi:hypothetical protein
VWGVCGIGKKDRGKNKDWSGAWWGKNEKLFGCPLLET